MHIYIHIEKVDCDIRLGFSFYARCLLIISARSRRKKEREREEGERRSVFLNKSRRNVVKHYNSFRVVNLETVSFTSQALIRPFLEATVL